VQSHDGTEMEAATVRKRSMEMLFTQTQVCAAQYNRSGRKFFHG